MARNKKAPANGTGMLTVMMARFSAIGDVAMTVPVIYSACRCYPDIRFVMVTRPAMADIFVNAPENLIVEGVDVNTRYKGPGGICRLVKEMAEQYRPDAFVDLHDVLRTRIMGLCCRLRGIRVARINKGRRAKRALTRDHVKMMLPLPSQRARYRQAFFKAGLPLTDRFDGLYGGRRRADASIFAAIAPPAPEGVKRVAVAPFAAHTGKIYPPAQMYEVVERLVRENDNVEVFLLGGGPAETPVLESWAERLPRVRNLAGKRYGFAVEMALLNHMDAVVTMDSANMHLSAIAGAPTVSIWGATHPYCGFKGWRQNDYDTVQLPMSCRPCSVFGDKPCRRGDYLCLQAIKPDVIYKKVIEKLYPHE